MEAFQALVAWLTEHPAWLSWAIFGIAFVESLAIAGIIVPGVAMIFAVAALAGRIEMPLFEALLWASLGAIAGDSISFVLGQRFKGRLDRLWPFSRYPRMIANGEQFFRQHGGKSVVIGRFVGPLRPVVPMVAGAMEMPVQRFFAFNVLSALGWAPVYVLPGFLVGSALTLDIDLPAHFYPVLGVCMAMLCLVYLIVFRLHWGLGQSSRLYQFAASLAQRNRLARRIWQRLSSPRADDREFPLASLTLAVASSALFVIWALLNMETSLLSGLNQATADFMSVLRHPLLTPSAVVITLLGDAMLLTLLIAVAAATLALRRFYAAAVHLLLAGLALSLLTTAIKHGFAIPRPGVFSESYGSFAFPSGHAGGITLLMGMAASFFAQETRRHQRWTVFTLFSFPVVLVATSRLYLGVHWMTDVIGGILLGLAVCGFSRVSFSRFNRHPILLNRWIAMALLAGLALTIAYVVLSLPDALALYTA